MAITVNDIREKEFKTEMRGYSRDEVDDFLDELAEQTEELAVENERLEGEAAKAAEEIKTLKAQLDEAVAHITKLEAAPAAPAAAAPAVVEEGLPAFNEPSYFKNLETTLRETLISAQRIADETIDDARKKARRIVEEAEQQAAAIDAESQKKLSELNTEYETVRAAAGEYHAAFSKLIEEQGKLLKDSTLFAAE